MADNGDILLHMIQEQWEQARQSEEQRATLTNIITVISAAIIGFLASRGLSKTTIPLSLLLAIIGTFGALVSAKYRERFYFHIHRTHGFTKRLEELYPETQIFERFKAADTAHKTNFHKLERVPLYSLWLALHISIALIGLITAAIVVV